MGNSEDKTVSVKCACCGHKLFDMKADTQGTIGIKCPKCKAVMAVRICNKRILVMPSK